MTEWPDKACPVAIEYSKEAVEQVRRLAVAGLHALPRVGLGVGGLLLGTWEEGRMSVLDSLAIPCGHALGPSFSLTPEELAYAVKVKRNAGPLSVVGWYCSKPSLTPRMSVLSDADLQIWTALCPDDWQSAFVLRPSDSGVCLGSFCFRDGARDLVIGRECPLDPVHAALPQVAAPVVNPRHPVMAAKMAAIKAIQTPGVSEPRVSEAGVSEPEVSEPEVSETPAAVEIPVNPVAPKLSAAPAQKPGAGSFWSRISRFWR